MAKYDIAAHFRYFLAAKEQHDDAIIDANKMTDEVYDACDLSQLTREELEYRLVSIYVRVLLNQAGYRSVVRGKGFYVNEETLNPELLIHLFNNEKMTRDTAERILAGIKSRIPHQMVMDFESGEYVETISVEELLRLLEDNSV